MNAGNGSIMQIIMLPGNPGFNADLRRYLETNYPNEQDFLPIDAGFFSNGEGRIKIIENARSSNAFVVQSSSGSYPGLSTPEEQQKHLERVGAILSSWRVLQGHENAEVRQAATSLLFGLTGIEALDQLGEDRLSAFLLSQTKKSVNDDFMLFLLTMDALVRADAASIRGVLPFMPYLRQDRKNQPRVPISAKLVANIIQRAGGNHFRGLVTSEMHVPQEQGFFDCSVDNLLMAPLFAADIQATMKRRGWGPENIVIVSPDLGGEKRAENIAAFLGIDVSAYKKERLENLEPKNTLLVPYGSNGYQIKGRHPILIDDIVDSGNTLKNVAEDLKEKKAADVTAYVTHGVLTPPAVDILSGPAIDQLILTNTLEQPPYVTHLVHQGKIAFINVAPLFGEAMRAAALPYGHQAGTVSRLFEIGPVRQICEKAGVRLGEHVKLPAPNT